MSKFEIQNYSMLWCYLGGGLPQLNNYNYFSLHIQLLRILMMSVLILISLCLVIHSCIHWFTHSPLTEPTLNKDLWTWKAIGPQGTPQRSDTSCLVWMKGPLPCGDREALGTCVKTVISGSLCFEGSTLSFPTPTPTRVICRHTSGPLREAVTHWWFVEI